MDFKEISWIDFFIVPVYLFILYRIVLSYKRKNPDNIIFKKYLLKGYLFKIFCALFYGLLMYYYYGISDSLSYYRNAMVVKQAIINGSETIMVIFQPFSYVADRYDLQGANSGWVVERIVLLLSYISFSRYLVITVILATIFYSGMIKMCMVFTELMPEWHKKIAFIVLFFPSLAVYGSGILKDSFCIASLGWLFYTSNAIFIKKNTSFKNIFILLLSFTVVILIKIYIISALAVPYMFFLLKLLAKKINNPLGQAIVIPAFICMLIFCYLFFQESINDALGNYATETLFETVKDQQRAYLNMDASDAGSNFDIGPMEPTLPGFLKKMPIGMTATLFRPYLWESRKFIMIFSALESLFILLFTIYVLVKAGIITFFKKFFSDPFILFCLSFSLIFAALVGVSTLNFGTLVRYRIPIIPFYLCGLTYVLYQVKHSVFKKIPAGKVV